MAKKNENSDYFCKDDNGTNFLQEYIDHWAKKKSKVYSCIKCHGKYNRDFIVSHLMLCLKQSLVTLSNYVLNSPEDGFQPGQEVIAYRDLFRCSFCIFYNVELAKITPAPQTFICPFCKQIVLVKKFLDHIRGHASISMKVDLSHCSYSRTAEGKNLNIHIGPTTGPSDSLEKPQSDDASSKSKMALDESLFFTLAYLDHRRNLIEDFVFLSKHSCDKCLKFEIKLKSLVCLFCKRKSAHTKELLKHLDEHAISSNLGEVESLKVLLNFRHHCKMIHDDWFGGVVRSPLKKCLYCSTLMENLPVRLFEIRALEWSPTRQCFFRCWLSHKTTVRFLTSEELIRHVIYKHAHELNEWPPSTLDPVEVAIRLLRHIASEHNCEMDGENCANCAVYWEQFNKEYSLELIRCPFDLQMMESPWFFLLHLIEKHKNRILSTDKEFAIVEMTLQEILKMENVNFIFEIE